jgi:hypothetical protein
MMFTLTIFRCIQLVLSSGIFYDISTADYTSVPEINTEYRRVSTKAQNSENILHKNRSGNELKPFKGVQATEVLELWL